MGESRILEALKRSLYKGMIVSVYSDRNQPGNFSAGFIDAISDEQFVMKHVTPEGTNDGYIMRRIEDVFRVDVHGEYEQRLRLLYTLQKQRHEDFLNGAVTEQSNLFVESLTIAQARNLIVTICIDETESQDDITGFVKEINTEEVTIARISSNGSNDGESIFLIEDITKMNCDTTAERLIKQLYNHQHKC
ncbi:hypothetical protein C1X05_12120 [Laceyella sacchari]|uniref:Uncharacterized protein n=1 Tax=Laceyella tengchongensis TaxID=574699 RepID=A0AA46AEG4_9BACL|nr:hypothetical protein [Laceyella tengchongensis]AUS09487.1 hypothetical protein C1X05_12120 [Laceyella sacchari]SMP12740.1 hypothetical protein SAMN06265361_102392 [Laceyella tengchongensis]